LWKKAKHEKIERKSNSRAVFITYSAQSVDAGVAGRARQLLVAAHADVLEGAGGPVLFGEAEVDYVNQRGAIFVSDHEVVGLYVAVDDVLFVDVFDARDLLYIIPYKTFSIILPSGPQSCTPSLKKTCTYSPGKGPPRTCLAAPSQGCCGRPKSRTTSPREFPLF